MMYIKYKIDIYQLYLFIGLILLAIILYTMVLSKSFGYALRSVIYVAVMSDRKKNIQLQEISEELAVPRHFLGKVMKRLAKNGILNSTKGHLGGFMLSQRTLSIPLIELVTLIEGDSIFDTCVIGLKKCNEKNPCPLHYQVVDAKRQMIKTFSETKIGDLIIQDKAELLKSLVTA